MKLTHSKLNEIKSQFQDCYVEVERTYTDYWTKTKTITTISLENASLSSYRRCGISIHKPKDWTTSFSCMMKCLYYDERRNIIRVKGQHDRNFYDGFIYSNKQYLRLRKLESL